MKISRLRISKLIDEHAETNLDLVVHSNTSGASIIDLTKPCMDKANLKTIAHIYKEASIEAIRWRIIFSKDRKSIYALFSDKNKPFAWIQSYSKDRKTKKYIRDHR